MFVFTKMPSRKYIRRTRSPTTTTKHKHKSRTPSPSQAKSRKEMSRRDKRITDKSRRLRDQKKQYFLSRLKMGRERLTEWYDSSTDKTHPMTEEDQALFKKMKERRLNR